MASVYFDSSVFLAIFTAAPEAGRIRDLLRELKRLRVKISTSIITVQEVSVSCYRKGTPARDYYADVNSLARIEAITRDVALTAAKYEAHLLDGKRPKPKTEPDPDNKRRKWDCFHIAAAVINGCSVLYSLDAGMLKRQVQFGIPNIAFQKPEPESALLPFGPSVSAEPLSSSDGDDDSDPSSAGEDRPQPTL